MKSIESFKGVALNAPQPTASEQTQDKRIINGTLSEFANKLREAFKKPTATFKILPLKNR